ncbi:MAG: sigma-54-dependent Fis family transcriptional regulator [Nitrospirae bacterium]|nr:sigma-54-dependent Fis family transcriptional regulator [Nitrospirota bacterium]
MSLNKDGRPQVVIVDDEPNFSESLQMALEDSFVVSAAHSLKRAREMFKKSMPDAILLDIRLSDGNGIDLLRELKALKQLPIVIMMTAYGAVDNAVAAIKEGAADYLTKPLDIEKLKRELNVHLENRFLQERVTSLDRELSLIKPTFKTSGTGRMKEIVDNAKMVASLNIPVLIKGETGTGKEKLAEWIHSLSGLSGEIVAINCSALPKDIFESEFFGHTRGAFSGAVANKEGLIERAEGGTLFLDEIGELPESVQAKFLRVLEEGGYYKVGETIERRTVFRLISATNSNLADPVRNFRQDLFFRINGIMFELPPLRERREDIPLLVSVFVKEANDSYSKNVLGVTPKTMDYFMKHSWPGNIRELKWAIHRAVAIATGDMIDMDGISANSGGSKKTARPEIDEALTFNDAITGLEKKYIEKALSETNNNKTEAAKILGISVRVLHYKIKQYGL